MKKMKGIILLSACLLCGSLTSCSTFFGDDGYTISSHEVSFDNNTGTTTVTIKFSDDTLDPMIITIPSGNGIDSIVPSVKDTEVVLTIKYTDKSKEDTVISIPLINGKDGKGIEEIKVDENDNGDMILKFTYTDGTTSPDLIIPKGKDGVGIKSIVPAFNEATNTTTVTITFTDDFMAPVVFTIENGVGIKSITYNEANSTVSEYSLTVTYNNGETSEILLPRPQSTKWYRGASEPSSSLGNVGDFYLNIATGNVYYKMSIDHWEYQFSMKGDSSSGGSTQVEYATVLFDPNGGEINGSTALAYESTVVGKTLDLSVIPLPTRSGFTFSGWYTTSSFNPNAGKITDLTPILNKNLTVYAWWE